MTKPDLQNRSPIRRQRAEVYVLITLLSFAVSVSLTRLFLDLTGYPQLGNKELHIAHVLWGGLFLFAASLLPLLFVNRWVYPITALLAGVGVGLFIDEVGKFITQNNDYFFPAAAPIIYAFFLLTVLLYVQVRKRRKMDARTELYYILQDLEEVLDHDLNEDERADILDHLDHINKKSADEDISLLAQYLHSFITNQKLEIVPENVPFWRHFQNRALAFEQNHISRNRYRAVLIGALVAWGVFTLFYTAALLLSMHNPDQLSLTLSGLINPRVVPDPSGLTWFETRIGLEGSMGVILLVASGLLAIGRDRRGVIVAYLGLLISLTVVNLLLFYYYQFSTIFNAIIQFIILLGLLHYRNRFMKNITPV
jgi:hypothetical protein